MTHFFFLLFLLSSPPYNPNGYLNCLWTFCHRGFNAQWPNIDTPDLVTTIYIFVRSFVLLKNLFICRVKYFGIFSLAPDMYVYWSSLIIHTTGILFNAQYIHTQRACTSNRKIYGYTYLMGRKSEYLGMCMTLHCNRIYVQNVQCASIGNGAWRI